MKKFKILILILASLTFSSCGNKASKALSQSIKPQIEENNKAKNSEGKFVVYFDTNSSKLSASEALSLENEVIAKLKNLSKGKKALIKIEGHCDERGSSDYNKKLGQKRAEEVKTLLNKKLAKSVKIKTVSYGKSRPVALGHDEESWAKNRRSVVISIQ